ncbi:SDR family NAD(P)-dependent oxidoreductase [Gemmatimonas groenlandica]|uniref:SDR family NAD(P)-dependent oxidoreductase n=2 Tax=Gemmatimonas groenlandica TaxID=2732249 RepID=A0A6M4ITW8_9BACT|nr:SDR family NAD(P)-dependent oxidoreductase [Gemmatimonas groenlandica]
MPNLSSPSEFAGKTVVVTGASDGIGKAAVRAYVAAGASVVMIGRNEAKTAAAARSIMSEVGAVSGTAGDQRAITWEIADLSRQEAVHDVADRLLARLPRIDVLANNAGAMFLDREVTPDGFERTFALNHLSYFTLTLRLLAPLVAASRPGAPARVLSVSSRAHENANPSLDDLQLERRFGGWKQYANSKLYNIWFTRALARRCDPSRVVTHALHPGVVSTRFATNNGRMGRLLRRVMDVVSVTPSQGADTLVWLSSAPEALEGSGDYWVKRRRVSPSRTARDDARAEQLWTTTSRLTGLDADQIIRNTMAHAVA